MSNDTNNPPEQGVGYMAPELVALLGTSIDSANLTRRLKHRLELPGESDTEGLTR